MIHMIRYENGSILDIYELEIPSLVDWISEGFFRTVPAHALHIHAGAMDGTCANCIANEAFGKAQ